MKRRQSERRPIIQWTFSFRLGSWFWICWLLLTATLVAWAWWGDHGFSTALRLRAERQALEEKNRVLQRNNDRFRYEIRMVQEDPSYLEWFARRSGMLGENERVYLFRE